MSAAAADSGGVSANGGTIVGSALGLAILAYGVITPTNALLAVTAAAVPIVAGRLIDGRR